MDVRLKSVQKISQSTDLNYMRNSDHNSECRCTYTIQAFSDHGIMVTDLIIPGKYDSLTNISSEFTKPSIALGVTDIGSIYACTEEY